VDTVNLDGRDLDDMGYCYGCPGGCNDCEPAPEVDETDEEEAES
jgi:hypothetical protein